MAGRRTALSTASLASASSSTRRAWLEDGALPGLDAAMEEYGKLSEQEPSDEELAATPQTATYPAAPQTASQRVEV